MPTLTTTLPSREGYTFTGFFDDASGGTKYYNADGSSAKSWWDKDTVDDTALYAHWTPNTYTVTFDAGDGTSPISTKNVTYGSPYGSLPTPTFYGHTFAGWWTSDSYTDEVTAETICTTANHHTLYALWTGNSIFVALDPVGGEIDGNQLFVRVQVGGKYPTLPTPTRGADTFNGWFTLKTGGTKVEANDNLISNNNHTLYAHWASDPATTHTVTFDAAGGTVGESSRNVSEGVAVGATTPLPTPTRTGYTFLGWFAQLKNTSFMGTENIAAVAKWQGNPMTITLDANGGDAVSPGTITVACGNRYGDLPIPTKSGKVFAGWFTAASGGTQVTANSVVTASITLYAHWNDAVAVYLDEVVFS